MPRGAVVPVLPYDDVGKAVEWLCGAFAFRERWRAGSHRAQLAVGDCAVAVTEGPPAAVMVRVDDVDAHHRRAREFGARVVSAPAEFPYGERQYTAEDPAGHRWTFSETIADVAPEEWGGVSAT